MKYFQTLISSESIRISLRISLSSANVLVTSIFLVETCIDRNFVYPHTPRVERKSVKYEAAVLMIWKVETFYRISITIYRMFRKFCVTFM